MDIDTLIFIIVFLAIVISNIKKILSEAKKKKGVEKQQQPEQPEKPGGLQRFMEKVAARIQEEIAPQPSDTPTGGKAKGGVSGWDAILGEEDMPPAPYEDPVAQTRIQNGSDDGPLEPEEIGPEIPETPYATGEIQPGPKPGISLQDKRGIDRHQESAAPVYPVYPVSELRRAVIWSEILGPPVALRE